MTLPEIKQISIREYFNNVGIHPTKEYGYYGLYHCPFREDQNASFKVDYNKNVWHDFGTSEGGSIIDLVMKLNNCSFNEAVRQLDNNTVKRTNDCIYQHHNVGTSQHCNANDFSFHRNEITSIQPISHPKLIQWLKERKIDLSLANLYCREVHYQNQSGNHFSIGFRNDNDGYELSSPNNFKGCISPKDITTIRNNKDACLVFEGFWDFLSYLTIQKIEKTKHDVTVLNSVANVQKAMDFLKTHKEIYTYLDNDEAGRKATELIKSAHSTVYNRSTKYAEYKDLNDYLRQKPMVKPEMKKKKLGLKR
ncbi:DNA primase [Bacteroidia bacterium]|nr:DNA primase [Bacteroidia bacterium]